MNDPMSSERDNLHHDDQGWNARSEFNTEEGPPIWNSDSIHAGIIKNDINLLNSSSRIHLQNDFVFKFVMLLSIILSRYL